MCGLCNFDSFTGIYFDGNKSENELNTTSAGLKYQSKHSARVKDKKRISYVLFLQFQYIWWINAKFLVISDQNKFIKIDIALFKYIYIYIYIYIYNKFNSRFWRKQSWDYLKTQWRP